MRATLEFNLPEDRHEHMAAVQGTDMAISLFEITENIRRKYLKHAVLSDEQYEIAEKIFDDIAEKINVNLDDILE